MERATCNGNHPKASDSSAFSLIRKKRGGFRPLLCRGKLEGYICGGVVVVLPLLIVPVPVVEPVPVPVVEDPVEL